MTLRALHTNSFQLSPNVSGVVAAPRVMPQLRAYALVAEGVMCSLLLAVGVIVTNMITKLAVTNVTDLATVVWLMACAILLAAGALSADNVRLDCEAARRTSEVVTAYAGGYELVHAAVATLQAEGRWGRQPLAHEPQRHRGRSAAQTATSGLLGVSRPAAC